MRPAVPALALLLLVAAPVALAQAPSAPAPAPAATRDADWKAAMDLWKGRASMKVHKEAMKVLAKVAEAYPKDYEIQWKTARAYYYFSQRYEREQGDIPRAAKLSKFGAAFANRALAAKDGGYEARYWFIMNYVRVVAAESQLKAMREAKGVRERLEKMIADEPGRFEAYMMLGGLMRALPPFPVSFGDTRKSLEILQKGEKASPDNPELLLELAETYKALGDTAKAREYYQKAATAPSPPEMDFETEDAHTYAKKMLTELGG